MLIISSLHHALAHSARPASNDNLQIRSREWIERASQHRSALQKSAASPAAVRWRKYCSANVQNELQVAALWVSNCKTINCTYRRHYSLSGRVIRHSGGGSLARIYDLILQYPAPEVTCPLFLHTNVLIPAYGFWKRQKGTQLSTSSKLWSLFLPAVFYQFFKKKCMSASCVREEKNQQ